MKRQPKQHALTGFSAILLFALLASQLVIGLPTPAFAQSADPGDATPLAPEATTPEPTEDPTAAPEPPIELTPTPEWTPEVTPTETLPAETLEPTPTETGEPEDEDELDPSLLYWALEMDVPVPSDQVQAMGGSVQTGVRLLSNLDQRITEEDVEIDLLGSRPVSGGTAYKVALEGSSTVQDFRHLLFASLGSDYDLLGGPVELVISGAVSAGQNLTFVLESRPATGYVWAVTGYDAALVAVVSRPEIESKASNPGAPAWETLSLTALADGETSIRISYRRSFEGEAPTRRLTVQASQLPEELDLSSPLPVASNPPPALQGPDATLQSLQSAPMVAALPSSFDWRSKGKVPAVRDQGTCGSCWAFGTAGVMESALLIQNNVSVDISEQYLISCNNNGWGCNGGWWAHDMHTNVGGKNNNPPGAVLEGEFPYANSNGSCTKVYNHPYKLAEWRYVSGINVPSVDQIKAAIYNYGPVAVSVCSIGWDKYTGGVYSANNTSCAGGVDHAVILVGWNDAEQTWILRNSWGSRWGESGYMRIRWGTSNVGYGASYVLMNKQQPTSGAPRNDDFNNAVAVANPGGKITFKETINVSGATVASDDPTFPFSSGATTGVNTVWYRFTTVNKGTLTLTTAGSGYDTVMGVWTGSRGSLKRIKWNDNANSDVKTSRISFTAAANTTYYINVASKKNQGTNLTFALTFTPPKAPNNEVSSAVKIPYAASGASYSEVRDIWSATTNASDPKFPLASGSSSGHRTVWYTIRPTTSGTLRVTTAGSNFDTLLGVFRNTRRLAWDDDSGGSGASSLNIRVAGMNTYRIMVSSKAKSPESRMQLNVTFIPDSAVGAGTYDNSHPAVAYVGSWTHIQSNGAYGNTIHQASQTQSIASLTFNGTGVDFLYTRTPGGGSVDIYIDGVKVASRSQSNSSVIYQAKWSSAALKPGTHTIVVLSTTTAGTNLDAFTVKP